MARNTYTDANRQLAALIKAMREEAGLNQVDLAVAVGHSQSWMSDVEAGQRRVDLIDLRTICRASGTTLQAFVERFEEGLPRE